MRSARFLSVCAIIRSPVRGSEVGLGLAVCSNIRGSERDEGWNQPEVNLGVNDTGLNFTPVRIIRVSLE